MRKHVTLQWSENKNGIFPSDRVETLLDCSVFITDKAQFNISNKTYYRQEIKIVYNREITDEDVFHLGVLVGSSLI